VKQVELEPDEDEGETEDELVLRARGIERLINLVRVDPVFSEPAPQHSGISDVLPGTQPFSRKALEQVIADAREVKLLRLERSSERQTSFYAEVLFHASLMLYGVEIDVETYDSKAEYAELFSRHHNALERLGYFHDECGNDTTPFDIDFFDPYTSVPRIWGIFEVSSSLNPVPGGLPESHEQREYWYRKGKKNIMLESRGSRERFYALRRFYADGRSNMNNDGVQYGKEHPLTIHISGTLTVKPTPTYLAKYATRGLSAMSDSALSFRFDHYGDWNGRSVVCNGMDSSVVIDNIFLETSSFRMKLFSETEQGIVSVDGGFTVMLKKGNSVTRRGNVIEITCGNVKSPATGSLISGYDSNFKLLSSLRTAGDSVVLRSGTTSLVLTTDPTDVYCNMARLMLASDPTVGLFVQMGVTGGRDTHSKPEYRLPRSIDLRAHYFPYEIRLSTIGQKNDMIIGFSNQIVTSVEMKAATSMAKWIGLGDVERGFKIFSDNATVILGADNEVFFLRDDVRLHGIKRLPHVKAMARIWLAYFYSMRIETFDSGIQSGTYVGRNEMLISLPGCGEILSGPSWLLHKAMTQFYSGRPLYEAVYDDVYGPARANRIPHMNEHPVVLGYSFPVETSFISGAQHDFMGVSFGRLDTYAQVIDDLIGQSNQEHPLVYVRFSSRLFIMTFSQVEVGFGSGSIGNSNNSSESEGGGSSVDGRRTLYYAEGRASAFVNYTSTFKSGERVSRGYTAFPSTILSATKTKTVE
jgi:hypothetical protein